MSANPAPSAGSWKPIPNSVSSLTQHCPANATAPLASKPDAVPGAGLERAAAKRAGVARDELAQRPVDVTTPLPRQPGRGELLVGHGAVSLGSWETRWLESPLRRRPESAI